MAENSPSNCTYCYTMECSLRIEPTSSVKKASISAKNSIVTVGRNGNKDILLQVELLNARNGQPTVASYPLLDAVLHTQLLAKGKVGIELPTRQMVVQLSNCPPRNLNVFVKSLQAKIDIMKEESKVLKTPTTKKNLLLGLPNVFNVLSPLSIGEIRKVRRLRGVATGESPLAKNGSRTPTRSRNVESKPLVKSNSATTPISSARERRLLQGSIGLKRMRTFGSFTSVDNLALQPLDPIAEEPSKKNRVELSQEQKAVVKAVVQEKHSVFFTGSAGTGKSVILKRIIELLPASSTFVTAATGVAACQIGGITLHSFAGIGVGAGTEEECFNRAMTQKHVVRQWKQCCYLIIDEISMIDRDYFSKLEYVARCIRGKDSPFGGIQLIITGDFLQLPPVTRGEPNFCFESETWNRCINKTILLKQVRRQDDMKFVKILQEIRFGRCQQQFVNILTQTSSKVFKDVMPTRLCTHSADAARINDYSLEKLNGAEKTFWALDDTHVPDAMELSVLKKLVLKVGAQVMLTKNIDLARGLSNGSRGIVKEFSEKTGNPIVLFAATNELIEISRSKFLIRLPGSESHMTRSQIPLQLAWAISIHKSQGLTLDCIQMSLSRVFAEGQVYVALSRARSLDSIKVEGFDASCVRANRKVVAYYTSLLENQEEQDECCFNDEDDQFMSRKRSRMSL